MKSAEGHWIIVFVIKRKAACWFHPMVQLLGARVWELMALSEAASTCTGSRALEVCSINLSQCLKTTSMFTTLSCPAPLVSTGGGNLSSPCCPGTPLKTMGSTERGCWMGAGQQCSLPIFAPMPWLALEPSEQ